MLDAGVVRVLKRPADLAHDPRPLRELERRADASEFEALDQLHDDHGLAPGLAQLEDLNDTRVGEERQ